MNRRSLLNKIKQSLKPRLYESGYTIGPIGKSRPYLVAPLAKPQNLNGFVVGEIEGFAEDGVVEEYAIGCVTIRWHAIPAEDLIRALRVVESAKTNWRPRP